MNQDDHRSFKQSLINIFNEHFEDAKNNIWARLFLIFGIVFAVMVGIFVETNAISLDFLIISGIPVLLFGFLFHLTKSDLKKDEASNLIDSIKINLSIDVSNKKLIVIWKLDSNLIKSLILPSKFSVMGYRLTNGLPHNPVEAKNKGHLIINTDQVEGSVIDPEIRPGQTGYYAVFVQEDVGFEDISEVCQNKQGSCYSRMATAVVQAPEGEMAKLARKIRYQELEDRLKSKSGQGGNIAETARKEIDDAVAKIENYKDLFKKIKETKEKSKEEIRRSNMSDEDKYELLDAIDTLADDVIDKKIGMGSMT